MNNKLNALLYSTLLGVGLSLISAAQAQTANDFYKGKTINLVVGFTPGGGYDAGSRTLARHMSKYLPNGY